jgi:hypothetical protein
MKLIKLLAVPVISILAVVGLTTTASATVTGLSFNSPAPLFKGITEVSGSVTCDPTTDVKVFINVQVLQAQGRQILIALGESPLAGLPCTGAPQSWTVEATTAPGQELKPGSASILVSAFSNSITSSQSVGGQIRLTPVRPKKP